MDLQNTFYVVGIVFMGLMIVLLIALLAAVLVLKAKIDHMHEMINDRLNIARDVRLKARTLFRTFKHFAKR